MKRVHKDGSAQITEKKSRFIGDVYNIENEEDALYYINETKKKYWDARHHCYAYIIGNNNEIKRFSDDGEPSGTAGKPILDVLDKSGIANCLIIVTRYFGGTLLGTGGLVRAYSKSVQEGLAQSRIITKYHGVLTEVGTDYNGVGKLQYLFAQKEIPIMNSQYEEAVKMQVLIPANRVDEIKKAVTEATNARASVTDLKELYFAVSEGEYLLFND